MASRAPEGPVEARAERYLRSGPTRGVQLHGAAAVSASGVYICCLQTLDGHDRTSTTRFIDIHIICDGGSPFYMKRLVKLEIHIVLRTEVRPARCNGYGLPLLVAFTLARR